MRAAREAVVGTIVERGDWGRMAGVRAMPGRARVCVQGLCGEGGRNVSLVLHDVLRFVFYGSHSLARSLREKGKEGKWKEEKGEKKDKHTNL